MNEQSGVHFYTNTHTRPHVVFQPTAIQGRNSTTNWSCGKDSIASSSSKPLPPFSDVTAHRSLISPLLICVKPSISRHILVFASWTRSFSSLRILVQKVVVVGYSYNKHAPGAPLRSSHPFLARCVFGIARASVLYSGLAGAEPLITSRTSTRSVNDGTRLTLAM